ncbi:hypothetical protein Zmor_002884 [Zophobas morio]|uniref:Cadherin domain-containing protein n=1 Tax=Zophobas morio TaxID=2755281 RepID=A0AA38HLR0_9CUCU|nr:hypothetical protein Zmor_002884 [Zophobas morio]
MENLYREKTILMLTAATSSTSARTNLLIGRLSFQNASSSELVFSISNQMDEHIAITSDGSLYTVKPMDRETRDVYRLTVLIE